MNIKETANVLKKAKSIRLVWNGNAIHFDRNDMLMMDAYGKYMVDEIHSVDEEQYEIVVAMHPVRECDA